MKRIRAAFMTGCLVLIPVFGTAQLILWLIRSVDSSLRNIFPTSYLPLDFAGLGIVLALTLIIFTGFLTQNYIGQVIVGVVDHGIRKVTFVGGIYSSIRKFLETILTPGGDKFHGVVLVSFPREGIYSVGFRTGKPDHRLIQDKSKQLVNIFVPCTPNPTSGFYLLVPESELVSLNMSVQEAFKIIISMGMVTQDEAEKRVRANV